MAEKQPEGNKRRYRVLRDFKDLAGNEHKIDDEIDLNPSEAQALVNADKVTAELKPKDE
jgi:hypothetical protein